MTRRTLIALPLLTTPVQGACLTQWIREASRTGVVAPARPPRSQYAEQWAEAIMACLKCITYRRDRRMLIDSIGQGLASNLHYANTPREKAHARTLIRAFCDVVRDLRDIEAIEAAIEKNAGKPLTDWEQAKRELNI